MKIFNYVLKIIYSYFCCDTTSPMPNNGQAVKF